MAAKLKAISSADNRHPLWRTSKRQNYWEKPKLIINVKFNFLATYLALMGDDDVFILVWRWETSELILFQSRRSVRGKQSLVLSHAQWLAFLPGEGSILRQQLTVVSYSINTELKT
jgi:hypothetical protein